MSVRTRFAPSPTGYLHIGNARSALFAWLFARQRQGSFILRIEDTDRERSTEEAIQAILTAMDWLGLDYDEGPYYQTQHFDRYREVIQQLLTSGHAYRCNCSKERLDQLREEQMNAKQKPHYDGHCRFLELTEDDGPYVVRFANPTSGQVRFTDLVYGNITVENTELDDLIIARTDGTPTYNFTVVIDDWDMKITHVIRGEDHINNTPRQINILNALGAELPIYAHLPMLLAADGTRLSKRHGAIGLLQYKEDGYLPEAMLNYLVRMGWSHGDQEIFTREEMIELFSLSVVNKSSASLNPEKLVWLNQHYMKTSDPVYIADLLSQYFEAQDIDIEKGPALLEIVELQAERCKTLVEMVDASRFFYQAVHTYDEKAVAKHCKPELIPVIEQVLQALRELDSWNKDIVHDTLTRIIEDNDLKFGKIAQPLRIAVSGGTVSPSIGITLALLGKEKVVQRIDAFLNHLKQAWACKGA